MALLPRVTLLTVSASPGRMVMVEAVAGLIVTSVVEAGTVPLLQLAAASQLPDPAAIQLAASSSRRDSRLSKPSRT